jgi:hypothetical protein
MIPKPPPLRFSHSRPACIEDVNGGKLAGHLPRLCPTDLQNWSTDGVTNSQPDASKFRTASVPMTGGKRFMRLVVGY